MSTSILAPTEGDAVCALPPPTKATSAGAYAARSVRGPGTQAHEPSKLAQRP